MLWARSQASQLLSLERRPPCSWSPEGGGGFCQHVERAKQIRLAACQAADPGDALKGLLFCKRGHVLLGGVSSLSTRPVLSVSPLGLCCHVCFSASEIICSRLPHAGRMRTHGK